jgi:hypothetical protein
METDAHREESEAYLRQFYAAEEEVTALITPPSQMPPDSDDDDDEDDVPDGLDPWGNRGGVLVD